ncbi:hypothetical protein [Lysinibacillus sp. NPDC093688]|uniref:hypothetical protein n=1 Tax=Lysinibacillus sp. NPDC093688 TaxID=3390577 RepID=UPI003D00E6C6
MGQQMFFVRKRSANVASATCFVCAKAKRQLQVFFVPVATLTVQKALAERS